MHVRTSLLLPIVGILMVAGCASTTSTATPTVTVTPSPVVLTFNPRTSGKVLAARVATRIKPKSAAVKVTGVECRNFPDLRVGTHTNCQMRVNGVKQGFRATFTLRDGHYVLKKQRQTW